MQNGKDGHTDDEKEAWIKRAGLRSWLRYEKNKREREQKREREREHVEHEEHVLHEEHVEHVELVELVEHVKLVEHVAVSHVAVSRSLKDRLKLQRRTLEKHWKIILNQTYSKEDLYKLSDEEKKSLSVTYLSGLTAQEKNKLYEKVCLILSEKLDYLLYKLK